MKRKSSIFMLVFIFALTPLLGTAQEADATNADERRDVNQENIDGLTIVRDGQATAVVLITEDADEQIHKAADTLVEYVQRSTGAELPVLTEEEWSEDEDNDDHIRIYIGNSAPGEEADIAAGLENLDEQGFLIYPRDEAVTIVGPSIWGTLNGVYEFLERYVGVRWLMPGPDGEDVPQLTDLIVPLEDVREEPAFAYRTISPFRGSPDEAGDRQLHNEWAQRNKLQGSYNEPLRFYVHNLHTLFPPEKYGESNPEFYPKGKPPAPDNKVGWQPCFTAEGTVDVAVAEILKYFEENPDETSFSLGVNDSGGYCEADPSHPEYPDQINSIGRVHMSEIYYAWVNEVVEQVLEVYPDKWFDLIAYQNVMDPPEFELNPRVVPFITKDRMAWIDGDIEVEGHQQMDEWTEVASQVAWYDYMYGIHYYVPRVFPHRMAENFQYAKHNNVMGTYTEMYHNGGDGPKAWISAKLQWDPEQDVDALLQEWYERAVGPEAASNLAAVYDLWEEFWTERIKGSTWFETGKGNTYLPFNKQSYLDLVTDEDIEESMRLLTSVVAKAETEQQKKRAQLLQRAFEFYKASALSYPRKIDPLEDEQAALDLLDKIANTLDDRIRLVSKRYELVEEFESDPILKFQSSRWYDWTGWNGPELWHLVDYMEKYEKAGGPVTNKVSELVRRSGPSHVRDFAQLLQAASEGTLSSLTENSSFEEGEETAPPWGHWIPTSGTIERVEGVARTGQASLLLDSMVRGGPTQFFSLQPGLTAARVHYYTPPGTDEGTIHLTLHAKNAQGQTLASYRTEAGLSSSAGEWSSIGLLEKIPDTIDGEEVTQAQMVIVVNNAPNTQVYIDDAVVYQPTPSSVNLHSLVEYFENEDEITDEGAARALKTHLTAVSRYEEKELAEKVIKHLEGFHRLLNHQRDNELLSERAYHVLKDEGESLMKWWGSF